MPTTIGLITVHGILSSSRTWHPLTELVRADSEISGHVDILNFEYPTRLVNMSVQRKLPDFDELAQYLDTVLREEFDANQPIMVLAHSQGGLIVQRYLAQQLDQGQAERLQRIRRIMMFATPNSGSEFMLSARRWLLRNPQERDLRPLSAKIFETQQKVLQQIVYAQDLTSNTVPIDIEAFAGLEDGIVLRQSAASVFRFGGMLPGDHSSIIKPTASTDLVYRVVKSRIQSELERHSRNGASESGARDEPPLLETSRDSVIDPTAGCSAESARRIASALADVPTLRNPVARVQLGMELPPYIQERAPVGSGNARLDLVTLVRVCAEFGRTGREALLVSLEFGFPDDPMLQQALKVIRAEWPQPRDEDAWIEP
ncbi:alpha/beta fold hydrolase [Nocardia cyriacigeorgica]|uniref:alpha/beta fold hydrolase n=1 Tax=Nocardia cyriacigeorgica TaxID=135487 RepID=UPI002455C670|nr:alpha/beta fold hydrolase [Nocardia cyriacigeorgica]